MPKVKLYIDPGARPHIHDSDPIYQGVVPFSKKGIEDHCVLTDGPSADFYYLGQFSDEFKSRLLPKYLPYIKTVLDIEGDWFGHTIQPWMHGCILTINGARKEYEGVNMCIRPTFSYLLMEMVKGAVPVAPLPCVATFGFRGFIDPLRVRDKLALAVKAAGVPHVYTLTQKWNGPNINEQIRLEYLSTLAANLISLCPRGCGVDSVRFFESCYMGRVPVVVGDNILMGEEYGYDTSFAFRISPDLSPTEMAVKLEEIYNTPISVLHDMAAAARQYWDEVVMEYFRDPTLYFLKRFYFD